MHAMARSAERPAPGPAARRRTGPGDTRARATPPRLDLVVQRACRSRRLPPAGALYALVRRWVSATLAACAARQAVIAVRFVTRGEATTLNTRYRARDYAPNVLSFPMASPGGSPEGDIAICPAVVATDASEQDRDFHAQLAHMVVHGVLHLAGYDHQRPAEAARMQAVESRVLVSLGYADPWACDTLDPAPGLARVSPPDARLSSSRATMPRRRPPSDS